MELKTPKIGDAEWAIPLLEANGFMGSEFAFTNVFVWQDYVATLIGEYKGFIIVQVDYKGDYINYQYPSGIGDIRTAIDAILEMAKEGDRPPSIIAIPDEGKELLEKFYPDVFDFSNPRGNNDYVYLSSDLANLPGGKYKKKRNHCSHFERSYPVWEFKEINGDVTEDILAFNQRWMDQHKSTDIEGIQGEYQAIRRALQNFESLKLKGGYLTVEDEIVAYSYGLPMGDEFVTHVEKALYDIDGGYAFINREMARYFGKDHTYINREDDVDDEGLRRAKLSYRPAFLVNKWRAEPKVWPPEK